MFDELQLVGKYGSWVKVQVAFYDFIFQEGTELCPAHWKEKADKEFKDGGDFYEQSVAQIEKRFVSFAAAWTAFLENERKETSDGTGVGD